MGDPGKTRSKYQGPRHPWNKERIEREKVLTYNYGLTNKKELWKVESKVKTFKDNIKRLIAQTSKQADIEREQLFTKLRKLGIIGASAGADDILGLGIETLLERRLQTLVFKQGLARSVKQARQFITHGHILIGDKKVGVPGYIVPVSEESQIAFTTTSSLFDPEHPERAVTEKTAVREKPEDSKSANKVTAVKSEEAKAEETMPTIETSTTAEEEKPIEQKIEEETSDVVEVAEAVKDAEVDEIAVDEEQELNNEANEIKTESKEEKAEEIIVEADENKKGDA